MLLRKLPLGKEPFVQIVIILTGPSYAVPQYKERERERESVQAVAVSLKNYVSNLGMYVGYKQLELFIIYTFACRASTCFLEHTIVPLCHLIFFVCCVDVSQPSIGGESEHSGGGGGGTGTADKFDTPPLTPLYSGDGGSHVSVSCKTSKSHAQDWSGSGMESHWPKTLRSETKAKSYPDRKMPESRYFTSNNNVVANCRINFISD
jgi:hypothetical protein